MGELASSLRPGGDKTVPFRVLAVLAFTCALTFVLSAYWLESQRGVQSATNAFWMAAAILVPISFLSAGYLAGSWHALWLLPIAFTAWVAADVIALGIFDGCGDADECKPPSLIFTFLFPLPWPPLAAALIGGVMLRRKPRAGAITLVSGIFVCAVIYWGITESQNDYVVYGDRSAPPNYDSVAGDGRARVTADGVARAISSSVPGIAPNQLECYPASVSGLGVWTCGVSSPLAGTGQPALIEIAPSGAYTGQFTDNHNASRPFRGCCVSVAAD